NLTKRCTLKCESCANLIQYYDRPERMDAEVVIQSVKNLLKAVDGIAMFKLMGGEPLLEQEMMKEILSLPELMPGGKVLGIQIITNGTILFKEDVLKIMQQNPLLGVLMSNYGSLSFKEQELKKQLSDHGVKYSEIPENDRWRDFGDPRKVYHEPEEASRLYRRCRSKENCCTVLEGRFYACPRAAHGDMLRFYPEPEEYVDLLGQQDSLSLRNKLKKFYNEYEATQVCARCTNLTGDLIERAVQAKGGRDI
nr:radical SAM protein [Butyrivibrio sp.]